MITTYLFPLTSVKKYLQCYRLYNFPYFRSSHWMCSVRKGVLRNFAKFSGKHLWQSLFLNKVAGWGDCVCSFSCLLLLNEDFLFISFQQKNEMKKGNTLMAMKYLLFCLSIDLFDVKDVKRNLADCNLIRKCVLREFDVAVFMVWGILLGKSFWVVNTWRAPVRKRLKGSTLNFAHTFLTDCCKKPCPRFS